MEAAVAKVEHSSATVVVIRNPLEYLADFLGEGSVSSLRRRLNRQTHAYEVDAVLALLSAIPPHAGCRLLNEATRNTVTPASVKRFMGELHEEVAYRREAISQESLAKIVGVSPSTISKWSNSDEVRLLLKLLRLAAATPDGRPFLDFALKAKDVPKFEKIPYKRYAVESLIQPEGLICISGASGSGKTVYAAAPLVRAAVRSASKATGLFMGRGATELLGVLPPGTSLKNQIHPSVIFRPGVMRRALDHFMWANPHKTHDAFVYTSVIQLLEKAGDAEDPIEAAKELAPNETVRAFLAYQFGRDSQYSTSVSGEAPPITEFLSNSLLVVPNARSDDLFTHMITAAFVGSHPQHSKNGFLVLLDEVGAINYGRPGNAVSEASQVWSTSKTPVLISDQHPAEPGCSHVLMNAACIIFRQSSAYMAGGFAGEEDARILCRLPVGEAMIRAPRYRGRDLVPLAPAST